MTLKHCWECFKLQRNWTIGRSYASMKRRVGGGRHPSQKKLPLTHFVGVMLVTPISRPQLEASLETFRDQVSPLAQAVQAVQNTERNDSVDGDVVLPYVHPKAIRPAGTLHCTLGVMSLDKDKLDEAIALLQNIDVQTLLDKASNSSKDAPGSNTAEMESQSGDLPSWDKPSTTSMPEQSNGPLKVDLKGLVSMHSAKSTSILYSAPFDVSGRLLPFCIALQGIFKEKGFITDDRPLKLHATIVNTIYAKRDKQPPKGSAFQSRFATAGDQGASTQRSSGHGPNTNAPLKIDATSILDKYEEFAWAKDVVLDRVAICEMGAKKVLDNDGNVKDEEYTEVAAVALPT